MAQNAKAAAGAAACLDTAEVTFAPSASKKPKNAAVKGTFVPGVSKKHFKSRSFVGNKIDNSWRYGASVDGSALKIRCKFCHKTVTRGSYQFRHHLAGTQKDAGACLAVPEKVKKEMLLIVKELQSISIKIARTQIEKMKIF